jgi:hypothetical protein
VTRNASAAAPGGFGSPPGSATMTATSPATAAEASTARRPLGPTAPNGSRAGDG